MLGGSDTRSTIVLIQGDAGVLLASLRVLFATRNRHIPSGEDERDRHCLKGCIGQENRCPHRKLFIRCVFGRVTYRKRSALLGCTIWYSVE